MLAWAARLHEAGLTISHSLYHKHGGYLVRNADLLGFSTSEQQRLAVLVRAHRRKFPGESFDVLCARARASQSFQSAWGEPSIWKADVATPQRNRSAAAVAIGSDGVSAARGHREPAVRFV